MHNPFITILAFVLLFLLARAAWNVHHSANSVSTKLSQAQAEEDKLESEKSDLSGKIAELSSPSGIESELRMKYRAVKDGELVAVIVSNTNNSQSTGSVPDDSGISTSGSGSLWSRFLGFFGL